MQTGRNYLKTFVLIAALGGLFVIIGQVIGGTGGALTALLIAFGFNFAMYWFSDKIAIKTTHSKPASEADYPQVYRIVRELAQLNQMPMPKIYVSDMMQPNAFATGRNPEHASVAGLSHDPMALASALRKLDAASGQVPPPASLSPAEAHMFIVNPMKALRGQGFSSLFSTHPPTARRIERLESMSGSRSTPFS